MARKSKADIGSKKDSKAKARKKSEKDTSALEQSFGAALKAVESSPESEDAWDHLEELADELQRPDEVGELYRKVIDKRMPKDLKETLSQRAVDFHEEWFGDNPEAMSSLFLRIIDIDPSAEWAFERLTLVLTLSKQWDQLLEVYDRMLGITQEPARRRRLLDDAAHVAKDFADKPDLAVDYLKQILALEPQNKTLIASIERLLERLNRWQELIDLWRRHIPNLRADEVRSVRARISTCYLEKMGDFGKSLDELRTLLGVSPGYPEGMELTEQILKSEKAPPEVRRGALDLLRTNYEAAGQPGDVVRVIELGLEFADGREWIALHREAGNRLADLGRDEEAIEHYATLLRRHPSDTEVRKQLTRLAQRSGRHDIYTRVLVEAADTCEEEGLKVSLLMEAAQIRRDLLNDAEGAIELYSRVVESGGADPSLVLSAAHVLNDLLASVGRIAERLAVLERLAALEQASSARRTVLGEAAKLAQEMGETQRAIDAWKTRLQTDSGDLEALERLIELYDATEQWEALIETLGRRADIRILPQQSRSDLIRIARVQAEKLGKPDKAIDTWLKVREEFGDDVEVVTALDELMADMERWSELADILKHSAQTGYGQAIRLLTRLGDLHAKYLGAPKEAVRYYTDALGIDPGNADAREGLRSLLKQPDAAGDALTALVGAFEATDDAEGQIEILEQRLDKAATGNDMIRILLRAAELQEHRAQDPAAAMHSLGRALVLAPADVTVEKELLRLTSVTGDWSAAAQVYKDAASAAGENAVRAAQLWYEAAKIMETRLDNTPGSLEAYEAAYRNDPRLFEVLKDVARMAARSGSWKNATWAVVELAAYRNYIDGEVIESLEQSAESAGAWDDICFSLTSNLAELGPRLRSDLMRDFELKTVVWHKDKRNDLKEAEKALQRATTHGDAHLPTLQILADLQRAAPDARLVETLKRIDDLTNRNLDALFEAAEVALNVCKDPKLTLSTLQRLFVRSTNLWSSAEKATGDKSVEFSAEWAMDRLVEHHLDSGDSLKAVQLLIDGARLPFEPAKAHAMRLRAAEILAQKGERQRAINLYFEILGDAAVDVATIQNVAQLCERENRAMELLALRLRELDMTEDPERRLELRLNISRTTGMFEEKGGRVETLLANLEERPGHEPTVEELYQLLYKRGDYEKLADILTAQAVKLEEKGESRVAAGLWARVATLSEQNLRDDDRAIEAHRRVVDLACTNEALDALAKLHTKKSDPATAAQWLERRLEGAGEKERVPILLKLSRARLTADKIDQALETLETAFEEAPRNAEVRRLLIDIYGNQENWADLARIYTRAAEHINDEATILAYAREAYDINKSKLDTPETCVSVLKKAVALDPDDRDLKRMLADSLYAAEELDDAREIAEELVKSYGRRRSPERASVHLLLSHIAKAEGEMEEALKEMETAAKMDHMNVSIQKALADLAREMGKLEEAELAYRTLLLTVRRFQADRAPYESVGQSEVLMELSRIAADRGQEDQASELRESAIEAVTQNDTEAPKLQNSLRSHGEIELLQRVLNTRLGLVKTQRKKGLIMADLAMLLETGLEKSDEALEMRLRAIETDPIFPQHHEAARDLAVRQGQLDRYVSTLEGLLKKKRRTGDAHVRCEVLLRLGEIMEKDHNDLEKAAEFYEKAEETGVREADVWRAAARVAGARGFVDQQMRLLNLLASMGEEQTETRATALYSLAEIQLAQEETLDEGIATLKKALEENARYERAGVILGRASEMHKNNDEILALYEQVARKSEDERRLLHFLEQRVAHPKATPEEAREAADLAVKFEEWERAEALMHRAVEIGTEVLDNPERVSWAYLALAHRRRQAGDLAGAVKWLEEAAAAAEADKVFALAREVVELASGPDGDLALVARLYETLLERHPSSREVWEPLAGIYAKMGEIDRLQIIVDETLDSLPDAGDRNALRIHYALALMGSKDRVDDAVEILRTVLLEDPENPDAKGMLIRYFERTGREDDLIELLQNNLFAAQGRKDLAAIKELTIQLGRRLEKTRTEEAVSLYRSSLEWVKDDRDLIKALLKVLGPDHDPRERAELMERLLTTEEEDKVVKLTFDLEALYYTLEDEAGALRALEAGYRRVPGNEKVFKRLEGIYERSGNFRDLARKVIEAAQLKGESPDAVKLFLKAASIFRDTLNDQASAMESLKMATDLSPDDTGIAVELAACMKAAGEHGQAIERIAEILDSNPAEDLRLRLLRMRAEIYLGTGQELSALDDLEEAYGFDRAVAPEMEEVLKRLAAIAIEKRDADMERRVTLRFVDLLLDQGSREEGRALLDAWTSQNPRDQEALHKLRDMDMKDRNWEGVAATCTRLASVEEGDDLIRCILLLSQAYGNIDRLSDARAVLEHAYRNQPEIKQIRDELRKVYEVMGVRRELAALLMEESKIVEEADEKVALLRRAGELLIDGGEATEAIPILENILSLMPDDLETTAVLADAYVGSMQLDSADIILDSAIEELKGRRSPELALIQHRKARVAGARGDRDLQLELLQQAFKTDRNNGIIAAELANLAEATENWDLAITALRNIPLIKTECPISKVEAYLRQGKISLRLGDQQRAVFWAKKAQKEDPDSVEAAEFLRQLGES